MINIKPLEFTYSKFHRRHTANALGIIYTIDELDSNSYHLFITNAREGANSLTSSGLDWIIKQANMDFQKRLSEWVTE